MSAIATTDSGVRSTDLDYPRPTLAIGNKPGLIQFPIAHTEFLIRCDRQTNFAFCGWKSRDFNLLIYYELLLFANSISKST
ncbi:MULTISPECIES: hypothetical protein [unclassified Microcoleus]|uniref:hypothetical protein n=1 Tax=unclassified Microcoleus TaxID=2642155 RepID=UPI002FCF3E04